MRATAAAPRRTDFVAESGLARSLARMTEEEGRARARTDERTNGRRAGGRKADRQTFAFFAPPRTSNRIKREEIALWTGIEGNGSIHDDEDGTIGPMLTMNIAKGLSICERTCYAAILPTLTQWLLNKKKEKVHL